MRVHRWTCLAVAASLLLSPGAARAQQPDAAALQAQIEQLKKEFGERIAALEAKLAEATKAFDPAGKGVEVEVETNGDQEQAAMDAVLALINDKFGEGE